ncbi:MAG: DNA polymerase III subunit beta [Elusimicrobiales bacterium]|jgi:DNA polymerase-3 subunit beta|nr:DNA polymerase III subunit beta [Elusimicrobiales bacterium]NLH39882.1 DNA polymerase III subunit beta [Elusimicrobiota bacterium]
MKILLSQNIFVESLNKIQSAVQSKSGSLPVLQNFLIEANKDYLKFVSTDLEIAIKHITREGFKTITEGSVTIPFKKVYEILSSIDKDSEVTVSSDDDKVSIVSGKTKIKIASLPVSDYPAIPSINEKESFKMNGFDIISMIDKTIFSASTDDKNSILNGLLWKKEKNIFTIAASDGRRLGVISRDLKNTVKKDFKVVIPSRILGEISSFIKSNCDKNDDVLVDISTNKIGFKIKDTDFISSFIEGNFPSYETIIPKNFESSATVDVNKLLNSTKRAIICNGDLKTGFVKYTFKKDVLIINSSSQSVDFEDEIDCDFSLKNEDFVIIYNPKFIVDILKNIESKNIEFHFTSQTTPTMLKTEEDPMLVYMIMPLKSY